MPDYNNPKLETGNIMKPLFNPVFFRTYSRRDNGLYETFDQTTDRVLGGIQEIGEFTEEELEMISLNQKSMKGFGSGRLLWVGGTPWSKGAGNEPGFYNCTCITVETVEDIAEMMNLGMMGCGTGAV